MEALHQGKPSRYNQLFARSIRWSAALLIMAAPAAQAQMATVGCVRSGNTPTISEAKAACDQDLQETFESIRKDPLANAYIFSPCSMTGGATIGFFAGSVFEYWFTSATYLHSYACQSLYDIILADGIKATPDNPNPTNVMSPTKSLGQPACDACVGDPINTGTGNVYRREEEVQLGPWLSWVRYYNSAAPDDGNSPMGQHWTHSYQRAWHYQAASGDTPARVTWQREDGKVYAFEYRDGQWQSERDDADTVQWQTDAANQPTSWTLHRADTNNTETYNAAGQLIRIVDAQGFAQQLDYQNGQLSEISDAQGRTLALTRDGAGRIQDVALPDGRHFRYAYDAGGNLSSVTYPDNTQQTYLYDEGNHLGGAPAGHRLTGVIDPRGARSDNYDYQSDGKAIATYTDGAINRHTVQYAANGSATTTDPLGATVTRSFSIIAGVPAITSLSGNRCQECGPFHSWNYDMFGRVHGATNFVGQNTTYTIDPDTQLETLREEGSRTTRTVWDTARRLPLVRNHSYSDFAFSEQWQYNGRGQPVAYCTSNASYNPSSYTCDAGNAVPEDGSTRRWTYTYCDSIGDNCPVIGLRVTATDPLGRTTRYSYYASTDLSGCNNSGACHYKGDLAQITNPLGQVTTLLAYDASGRVTRWQDANGIITDLAYTSRGWLAQQTVHAERDATTQMAYDAHGSLTQVTDPDGVVLHFTYDIADRLTDIQDTSGDKIHYTLDAAGNRTAEQVGNASQLHDRLTRAYSNLGRINTLKDAQGQTVFTATSYDGQARLTMSTDAYGVKRGFSYNLLSELTELTEDQGNSADPSSGNATTTLTYNGYDQITKVVDPDKFTTTYKIDGFGQTTAVQSNDTGLTSNTYDAAGNLLTRTDARGITATFSYDALNRVTLIQYPNASETVYFAYDEPSSITGCASSYPVGRLTRRSEAGTTTNYCYNAQGQVIQKRQAGDGGGASDTLVYAYSAAGRLTGVGYPSGTQVTYLRDSDGRITQVNLAPVNGAALTLVSNVHYQPFGPIASYTLSNGQAVTRSFDANDRISAITSPAFSVQYGRDAMGNIITTASNNVLNGYLYDHLYRITQMQDGDGNPLETFSYSKTGDRKAKTGSGLATGDYGYQNHWLMSIGNEARTYDAAGNSLTSQVGGNQYAYAYNNDHQLGALTVNGGATTYYANTVNGERFAKHINGSVERYVYNEALHLMGEAGITDRDYIWLDDMPIAVVDNGNSVHYVIADALNTPRAITDSMGATVWQWSIENNAFGEQQPIGGFTYNLRFPGQYYDEESGLFYNVRRYYEPATGRYIQSDPLGLLAGVNTYAYVNGSPLMVSDANGECPWCLAGAIIGAVANTGFQLYRNGGDWGKIDIQQVGLAAAGGFLSGGLGTLAAAAEFGVAGNLIANGVGSGVISGAQQAAGNALQGRCLTEGVLDSAAKGSLFGTAGAAVGSGINAAYGAYSRVAFNGLPLSDQLFRTSNALYGPYLSKSAAAWAAGGTVTANAASTLISNANQ
jgi:RHS repeat-associated protein